MDRQELSDAVWDRKRTRPDRGVRLGTQSMADDEKHTRKRLECGSIKGKRQCQGRPTKDESAMVC